MKPSGEHARLSSGALCVKRQHPSQALAVNREPTAASTPGPARPATRGCSGPFAFRVPARVRSGRLARSTFGFSFSPSPRLALGGASSLLGPTRSPAGDGLGPTSEAGKARLLAQGPCHFPRGAWWSPRGRQASSEQTTVHWSAAPVLPPELSAQGRREKSWGSRRGRGSRGGGLESLSPSLAQPGPGSRWRGGGVRLDGTSSAPAPSSCGSPPRGLG